jgi:hypothetical protein
MNIVEKITSRSDVGLMGSLIVRKAGFFMQKIWHKELTGLGGDVFAFAQQRRKNELLFCPFLQLMLEANESL